MKLTISLAQMSFEFGQVEANFERVSEWIVEAAERGSDLVLLPELWASGYDLKNWPQYATALDDGLFPRVAELAHQNHIAVGGSLLETHGDRAFNSFVLFGPDGTRWGVYRKVHLFRLLNEEKWLDAGDELPLFETRWGDTGLSICYDLRFPEIFRNYALRGAKLILLVAEWPVTRIAHWSKLLQARAIENQFFVAAVNKVGTSKGVKLGGHSLIADPWGAPLVEGGDSEVLLTAELDFGEVEKARRFIPVFDDRRPDVYAECNQREK
ncbi:MAG: carbon-nitrogen family hydrolase [Chloroflexota bacterium]|nr:carbon-nitrogen family hydrolase [Chloroflexota bacterium]